MSAADAQRAGALFYCLPEALTDEMIDPLLRRAVRRINASGWCWTAESCQGHPEEDRDDPWAGNTRPFLRLVCHKDRFGDMLAALTRSMRYVPSFPMPAGQPPMELMPQSLTMELFAWPEPTGDYEQVLVYIRADNVYRRNLGVAAFERFAEAVCASST